MNYYKHHLGDYAKKTAHLSLIEHGAYLLMLHAYYGTEKPLPTGEPLYRMVRAQSKAERAAVDSVAAQFWSTTEMGLTNGRAFKELEEASQQVIASRENGKLGGRPKKTQQVLESEPNHNLLQTPDSTSQIFPTQTLPAEQEGLSLRERGKNPRALGTNPRAESVNPRALGTNPRAEKKSRVQEALNRWSRLINSDGADRNDPGVGRALAAVGGWPAIRMRTVDEEPRMRKTFCAAYLEATP